MTANVSSASRQSRLAFIDLLRGWAILVMIEVHVFNAFMATDLRTESWFHAVNFINGLVAPSFIFISGFIFSFTSERKLESFRQFGGAFWKQCGRIAMIGILGYSYHLPFYSLHRSLTESTQAQIQGFYQVDVLQCIACGLLVLFVLRLTIRNDRFYKMALLGGALFVILATRIIWDIDFSRWIASPLAAYLNSTQYSLFPLFPWIGFMLLGGYFAIGYGTARQKGKEKDYILRFALLGAILMSSGAIGRELPFTMHIGSWDVRANPLFFAERLGIVMLLLTICWYYGDYRKTERSFVLVASRDSLLIYAAHLLVIYGRFWPDRSFAYLYGGLLNGWECLLATSLLSVGMIGAAAVWGWMKRYHLPLARVLFALFVTTVTLVFLLH